MDRYNPKPLPIVCQWIMIVTFLLFKFLIIPAAMVWMIFVILGVIKV